MTLANPLTRKHSKIQLRLRQLGFLRCLGGHKRSPREKHHGFNANGMIIVQHEAITGDVVTPPPRCHGMDASAIRPWSNKLVIRHRLLSETCEPSLQVEAKASPSG